MGLSKLPLPIYIIIVFGVSVFLLYSFITRFKKDRKALLTIYSTFSMAGICIGLITIFDKIAIVLPRFLSTIFNIFIAVNLLIGFISINYAGWTNKKDPNAKKKMIFASCLYVIGLIAIVYLVILIKQTSNLN